MHSPNFHVYSYSYIYILSLLVQYQLFYRVSCEVQSPGDMVLPSPTAVESREKEGGFTHLPPVCSNATTPHPSSHYWVVEYMNNRRCVQLFEPLLWCVVLCTWETSLAVRLASLKISFAVRLQFSIACDMQIASYIPRPWSKANM